MPMISLIAVVLSPGVRVTVSESLNRDIGKVSDWCERGLIVSWSRTMQRDQPPSLTIGGTVLKGCDDIDKLGVIFDSDMTFEKHLR